jgi:hypothetical protein
MPIRLLLLFFLFISYQNNAKSQDWHIEFLKDSITTSEFSKVDSYKFKVPYTIKKLCDNAEELSLDVATLYSLGAIEKTDYSIDTRKIKLDPSTLDTGTIRQASISITIQTDKHIEKEEKAIIGFKIGNSDKIKSDTSSFLLILESEEPKYVFDAKNPFRFAIGSNFDLLDGIKSDDLYSEISFRDRNLLKQKIPIERIERWIGLDVGIYQNKSATYSPDSMDTENLNERNFHRRILDIEGTSNDSTQISIHDVNYRLISNQSRNLGLYVNPTFLKDYDLNNDGKGDLALGYGIYLEAVRRDITYEYAFKDTLSTNTERISQNTLSAYQRIYPTNISNKISHSTTKYDRFYGISIPVYYENKHGEFYLNFATGWGVFNSRNLALSEIENPGFLNHTIFKNTYYITKWKIIEKNSGIQFSGEFRGFYSHDKDNLVTLNLSKVFDLTKLLTF